MGTPGWQDGSAGDAQPGRAEGLAETMHELTRKGMALDRVIEVLTCEAESSTELLTAVLAYCRQRARGDSTWQRAATAVQATIGAGLFARA